MCWVGVVLSVFLGAVSGDVLVAVRKVLGL